jgi:hypothetical protein
VNCSDMIVCNGRASHSQAGVAAAHRQGPVSA